MGLRRINLLPPEERQKASRERGLMYALLALVLIVAILGGLYVIENRSVSDKEGELAGLQTELASLTARMNELKPYELMQSRRSAMVQAAQQIFESRVTWSSIFEEISLLVPENVSLTTLTAMVPPTMLAGSQLIGGAASGGPDITIEGKAYSHRDVAEFMTRLGLMPQLMRIQLVNAEKAESSGETTFEVVSFQITANLRPFQQQAPLSGAIAGEGSQTVETGQ